MAKHIDPIPLPPHDEIAACAYQIYVEEGSLPGHELDHWLKAEARLMDAHSKSRKKKGKETQMHTRPAQFMAV